MCIRFIWTRAGRVWVDKAVSCAVEDHENLWCCIGHCCRKEEKPWKDTKETFKVWRKEEQRVIPTASLTSVYWHAFSLLPWKQFWSLTEAQSEIMHMMLPVFAKLYRFVFEHLLPSLPLSSSLKTVLRCQLEGEKNHDFIIADLLHTPLGSTTRFWKHDHLFLWHSCITPCCLFHFQRAGVVFVTTFFIKAFVTFFCAFSHSGERDRTCL